MQNDDFKKNMVNFYRGMTPDVNSALNY